MRSMNMSLISILIGLSIVGVVLWLINTYIPLDGKIKKTLTVVVVIGVLLWLSSAFGVFGTPSDIYIGDLHM
jgi:hypothetical protein